MTAPPTHDLFERIAERLKALSDPTRLKILHALEDQELCVSDILAVVGGSQANVSKHLSRMRSSGVLASRREGTNIYYRVVALEGCCLGGATGPAMKAALIFAAFVVFWWVLQTKILPRFGVPT